MTSQCVPDGTVRVKRNRGRADNLVLVAADLQTRQAKAVANHDGLRKRTARARVESGLVLDPRTAGAPPG